MCDCGFSSWHSTDEKPAECRSVWSTHGRGMVRSGVQQGVTVPGPGAAVALVVTLAIRFGTDPLVGRFKV